MKKLPIETENPLFGKYLYPVANEIRIKQQDITWTAEEIPVKKDIHDYRTNMEEKPLQLVTFTLQSFVEIEQKVGDVWEKIASWFPHSEIQGACIEIARMEKAVHAFFYQKMSDELNIDPEEIARNQKVITVIRNKLSLLEDITANLSDDKPLSLGTVAMIEQVLLFSNFAMLKSFQANGHNLIANTITGVGYVQNDEQLHGVFAAYLHNTFISEYIAMNGSYPLGELRSKLSVVANQIIQHEDAVINYLFDGVDKINDISAVDLKVFIRNRADGVMIDLNHPTLFNSTGVDRIADWFYRGANSIKIHDFFVAGTNQYSRTWSLEGFSRLPFINKDTNE